MRNTDSQDRNNSLKKKENLLKLLINNFQQSYIPERGISIKEFLPLFKEKLEWKQYISSKEHDSD